MKKNEEGLNNRFDVLYFSIAFMLILFMAYLNTKLDKIHENQKDIDARITAIEQSQCETDNIIIDVLQKTNECMYKLNK